MKQANAYRIEGEILEQVENVIDGVFTVTVGSRTQGSFPQEQKFDIVIFSDTKDKKETKKLVKALVNLAEDADITPYSYNKHEVVFHKGDLKKLFPKSGFLSANDRSHLQEGIDGLETAESDLSWVSHNSKVQKILDKITVLRYKLMDV